MKSVGVGRLTHLGLRQYLCHDAFKRVLNRFHVATRGALGWFLRAPVEQLARVME